MTTTAQHLNEAGTHVLTNSPTGDPWWCPADYLPFALERGFELAAPSDPAPGQDPALMPFNPSDHDVPTVNDFLAAMSAAENQPEIDRVLAAEAADQNRNTVQAPAAGDSTTEA